MRITELSCKITLFFAGWMLILSPCKVFGQEQLSRQAVDSLSELFAREADLEAITVFGEWAAEEEEQLSPSYPGNKGMLMSTLWHQWSKLPDPNRQDTPGFRQRLRLGYRDHWEFRTLLDHDPGESFSKGPDHASASLMITPATKLRRFAIGDYQINAGFGLALGTAPMISFLSGSTDRLQRRGRGLGLHPGTDENRFCRGLAQRWELGRFVIQAGVSAKRVDAVIDSVGVITGKPMITKLLQSGVHLSERELQARHSTAEEMAFVNVEYGWNSGYAGLVLFGLSLPRPLWPDQTSLSDWQAGASGFVRYGLYGATRTALGLLQGELAVCAFHGLAAELGFKSFSYHGFSMALKGLKVSAGYPVCYSAAQHGQAILQGGQRLEWVMHYSGKRLFSAGLGLRCERKYLFDAMDFSSRQELILHIAGSLPGELQWSAVCRNRFKHPSLLWQPGGFSGSAHIQNAPDAPWRFRLGVAFAHGAALTDLRCGYAVAGSMVSGWFGVKLFNVDEGSGPLYAYEPDTRYAFSVPAFSGTGSRYFMTMKLIPAAAWVLEIKAWRNVYADAGRKLDMPDPASDFGSRYGLRVQLTRLLGSDVQEQHLPMGKEK